MTPGQAIDIQFDINVFWESKLGRKYAQGFFNDISEKHGRMSPGEVLIASSQLVESQKEITGYGDAFIVDENMCILIEEAAKSMPGQKLFAQELPADKGIVFFTKPLVTFDVRGNMFEIPIATWHSSDAGILVSYYNELDWAHQAGMPQFTMLHCRVMKGGEDPRELLREMEDLGRQAGVQEDILRRSIESEIAAMRQMEAFWALTHQKVPHIESAIPERSFRRRWTRMKKEPPTVSVITLRREEGPEKPDDVHEVEWSHRWIVSGHWRTITNKDGEQRAVWVRAHVKGPEDKPLIPKNKVYRLSR